MLSTFLVLPRTESSVFGEQHLSPSLDLLCRKEMVCIEISHVICAKSHVLNGRIAPAYVAQSDKCKKFSIPISKSHYQQRRLTLSMVQCLPATKYSIPLRWLRLFSLRGWQTAIPRLSVNRRNPIKEQNNLANLNFPLLPVFQKDEYDEVANAEALSWQSKGATRNGHDYPAAGVIYERKKAYAISGTRLHHLSVARLPRRGTPRPWLDTKHQRRWRLGE
jgi:hypothetical protein